MAFSLRYALLGPGRSMVSLEVDDLRIVMHTTDRTDALADLARAVIGLLEGDGEASMVLEDSPGVHEWNFERIDRVAHLRIHSWADRGSGLSEMSLCQERSVSFAFPVIGLARELVLVLDVLWVGHGPDGWARLSPRHRFPSNERRRLRQLLSVAARRGAEQQAAQDGKQPGE